MQIKNNYLIKSIKSSKLLLEVTIMLIELNFIPFESEEFKINIFRRKYNQEPRTDGFFIEKLPINAPDNNESREYEQCLISLNPFDDAIEYEFHSKDNHVLMIAIIWYLFKQKVTNEYSSGEYEIIDGFKRFISFIVEKHPPYGNRVVKVSPYYLAVEKKYGFLLEFDFRKSSEIKYDKKVQELSFSLDKSGKSNANAYLDKKNIIQKFITEHFVTLQELKIGNKTHKVSSCFISLVSKELADRSYFFYDRKPDSDKSKGLKNYGPYNIPTLPPLYVFIFRDNEQEVGNELYKALIGKTYHSTFVGMKEMFHTELSTSNVKSIYTDLKNNDDSLLFKLKEIIDSNQDKKTIGIFIDSYSIGYIRSLEYIRLKHIFYKLNLPLQAVRRDRILASEGLKWAAAGIGLQIFAKLGGVPWLVKPSTPECLIFGIGTAHEREIFKDEKGNEKTRIKRYYAYSVCLDSTGLYKSMGFLGESDKEAAYLSSLKDNIISYVKDQLSKGQEITNCVIHSPFKLKNNEMKSIKNALLTLKEEYKDISFSVIKINTKNRFFGFADNNLKVPYESSYIQLSNKEYLIWFEGLKKGREYINKRIANPAHIEFMYMSDRVDKVMLLQDLVNLAGASWRGFNAKLEPISIFYPNLVARFIKEFRQIDKTYESNLNQFDTPWFL